MTDHKYIVNAKFQKSNDLDLTSIDNITQGQSGHRMPCKYSYKGDMTVSKSVKSLHPDHIKQSEYMKIQVDTNSNGGERSTKQSTFGGCTPDMFYERGSLTVNKKFCKVKSRYLQSKSQSKQKGELLC